MMTPSQQTSVKALGQIEGYKTDIETLMLSLDAAPLWRPGAALKKQCERVLAMIDDLEKRMDRKLIVTLIGPTGAGKSTLLNALAGADRLSETGADRPTTRSLVVLCRERSDAAPLIQELGDQDVQTRSSPMADALEHALLVDTPDTDSTEQEKHIPLVKKAIGVSDVLICVFNSENPKRKDYVDFLDPYVRMFGGESLVCVMNKCDRQDETELKTVILPEFLDYIKTAWNRPADRVLCVSARRHLNDPGWDPKAGPRHDFDEFDALRNMIFGAYRQAGYVIDRRVENARSLRDFMVGEVRREAAADADRLAAARERMADVESRAVQNSLSALRVEDPKQALGVNVLLYQKLAQRWLGPVGWLIAVWARILIFGTGMAAIFRFGNPLQQVMGMISSYRHFRDSRAAVAETGDSEKVDAALRRHRTALLREWPDIAESLVRARFDASVRNLDRIMMSQEKLSEGLSLLWRDALDSALETFSRNLSGIFIQLAFNIPVLTILGYAGWITARAFFAGEYFRADFFLHAFLTIAIILFLCFFLFQGCVRLFAGTRRITSRAFEDVKAGAGRFDGDMLNPAADQADAVIGLSAGRRPKA